MNYCISDFSKITGISLHTLRYYEKEELITPSRTPNGRRCYSDSDISWLEFIKRLKETGMPIRQIQKYAQLRAQGNSTMQDRMQMLVEHHQNLKEKINQLNQHMTKLDDKIIYYQTEIDKL